MSDEAEEKVLDFAGQFGVAELMQRAKARQHAEAAPPGRAVPEPPRPAEVVPPAVPTGDDDADPFPAEGDAYKAHSRPGNKPELMLGLRLANGLPQAFAYGDLRHVGFEDAGRPGGHPALVLAFLGVGTVRLEGRRLDTLFEAFRRQRLAWLWERPKGRDFLAGDDAGVVITAITITRAE